MYASAHLHVVTGGPQGRLGAISEFPVLSRIGVGWVNNIHVFQAAANYLAGGHAEWRILRESDKPTKHDVYLPGEAVPPSIVVSPGQPLVDADAPHNGGIDTALHASNLHWSDHSVAGWVVDVHTVDKPAVSFFHEYADYADAGPSQPIKDASFAAEFRCFLVAWTQNHEDAYGSLGEHTFLALGHFDWSVTGSGKASNKGFEASGTPEVTATGLSPISPPREAHLAGCETCLPGKAYTRRVIT